MDMEYSWPISVHVHEALNDDGWKRQVHQSMVKTNYTCRNHSRKLAMLVAGGVINEMMRNEMKPS
eukprot:scaffold242231_cov19-Prasinocladus_malaysianus.AAC.1